MTPPMEGKVLTEGQWVRVRLAGTVDDWCMGKVEFASPNGQSVGLTLLGAVRAQGGLIAGALPLLVDYEAETVTSLFGDEYEMEVADPQ